MACRVFAEKVRHVLATGGNGDIWCDQGHQSRPRLDGDLHHPQVPDTASQGEGQFNIRINKRNATCLCTNKLQVCDGISL